jgi:hypothetical protein
MVTPEDYHDFKPELHAEAAPVTKKCGQLPKADGALIKKKLQMGVEGSAKGKARVRAKDAVEEDVDKLDVIESDKENEIKEHNVKILMYVNVETPLFVSPAM